MGAPSPLEETDIVVAAEPIDDSSNGGKITTADPEIPVAAAAVVVPSGTNAQLLPSLKPGTDYRVTVKHNLWLSSTLATQVATYTDSGQPFPIRMESQQQGGQTKVVIFDEKTQQPSAVLRKNDPQNPDKFTIFGLVPYMPNQKPSVTVKYDDGRPLYKWGSLANADCTLMSYASKRKFNLIMQNGWQFIAQRDGGGGGFFAGRNDSKPKHYSISVATHNTTVTKRNVKCNVSKGASYATLQQSGQDWMVHVQAHSEHDPGLMIALALMLDELHRSRM